MIDKVRISTTWYIFLSIGLILLFYGKYRTDFLYIFLGSFSFIGGITCALTGLLIKYFRNKKRQK